MLLTLLRDAPWLTRRRLRDYSTILLGLYAAAAIWLFAGSGINDPAGRPIGTDFLSFWTVSTALHRGETAAIYHPERLSALEQAVTPQSPGLYAWAYPPMALLLVYPLAFLPYLWALAAWLAAGMALYLSVLWRILPRPLALWAGLAFPAVLVTLDHGQNGLLTTGLMGWALLLLPGRPAAAGLLFGALAFKPQLGLLIPVALACGGHWRAFAAAALSVLGLAAAALLLFGSAIWSDFLASLPFARAILEQGLVPYFKMQSIFAATRLLGAPATAAYAVQAAVSLGAVAATAWAWRGPAPAPIKNAVLVTASVLATPFVFDYDLMLLALPVAWLIAAPGGLRPWEGSALAAACLAPLLSRPFAALTDVILTPALVAALLLVLLARCRAGVPSVVQSPTYA